MRNDESDLNSQLKTEKIERVGIAHQAGSDSLVTLQLFHKSLNHPLYKRQNLQVSAMNVIHKLGDLYKRDVKKDFNSANHFYVPKPKANNRLDYKVTYRQKFHSNSQDDFNMQNMCNNLENMLRSGQGGG
jgi:tRNA(Ile)-lysidine synthase TilS/MesJ